MNKFFRMAFASLVAAFLASCELPSGLSSSPSSGGLAVSPLIAEFTRQVWNAAAPHFDGLKTVEGPSEPFEEGYPFTIDSSASNDFAGFAYSGDAPVPYPEGHECPPLDDLRIYGGIRLRMAFDESAAFAPRMGFVGQEVDALCLVVTGMIGSSPFLDAVSGVEFDTDYAVLLLLSDGCSTFGALEWHSRDNPSMYTYNGDPSAYILERTSFRYEACYLQSIIGCDSFFDQIDFAFGFVPTADRSAIADVIVNARHAGTFETFEASGVSVSPSYEEAVFEESVEVQRLRDLYGSTEK